MQAARGASGGAAEAGGALVAKRREHGVRNHEAGGMTNEELLSAIKELHAASEARNNERYSNITAMLTEMKRANDVVVFDITASRTELLKRTDSMVRGREVIAVKTTIPELVRQKMSKSDVVDTVCKAVATRSRGRASVTPHSVEMQYNVVFRKVTWSTRRREEAARKEAIPDVSPAGDGVAGVGVAGDGGDNDDDDDYEWEEHSDVGGGGYETDSLEDDEGSDVD